MFFSNRMCDQRNLDQSGSKQILPSPPFLVYCFRFKAKYDYDQDNVNGHVIYSIRSEWTTVRLSEVDGLSKYQDIRIFKHN